MTIFGKWPKLLTMHGLCKMLSLSQKIKFSKTCGKRLYKHVGVFLCKKRLQNAPNIKKMTTFRKWPKLVTMHGLQRLQNAQFGSKIKILKHMWKMTLQAHQSCSVQKKRVQKARKIRKLTPFRKWPKLLTMRGLSVFATCSVWFKN